MTTVGSAGDVKDLALADEGKKRVEWAFQEMPVLQRLLGTFERDKPLAGVRLSGCLHITTETANLARVLTVLSERKLGLAAGGTK